MSSIRVLIFSALFFLFFTHARSQGQPGKDRELADSYMEAGQLMLEGSQALDDARDVFVFAAEADTTYAKANFEAGRLHLMTINKDVAVKFLMRVLREDPDYKFDLEYHIGRAYHYGLEFDKALEYYSRYKKKLAARPDYQGKDRTPLNLVERSIFQCENGKKYYSNPRDFSITNIGREINSNFDDYGPVLNESEDELVFTTRRLEGNLSEDVFEDNKPWEDIFISLREGNKWGVAKNIGKPVNTETHNANLALSADGKLLFTYSDEVGDGDIFVTERQDNGTWSTPEPLGGNINSSFKESAITISKDEKTVYFTSNRPGGYGGSDIYTATRDSRGEWTRVRNLGPKINTPYDEEGPFIDYDQVTLYFSSEGHNGMGGHDVFKSTYDPNKKEWSEPENLGYPVNTPDHDLYFIASRDSKRAYYSSFREDGMGYQDIYMITIPEGLKDLAPIEPKTEPVAKNPEPVKKDTATTTVAVTEPKKDPVVTRPEEPKKDPVNTTNTTTQKDPPVTKTDPPQQQPIIPVKYVVTVVDASSKAPLAAKINMVGAADNVIVRSRSVGTGVTEFTVSSTNAKDYRLSVDMMGYIFQNQTVRIVGATTSEKIINRTVEMRKLSVGAVSVLRNIYFDFNKASFKTESYTELNKLEAMLRQNGQVKVEIGGHTDDMGSYNYNLFLSRKRAEAVKDYLTKRGIDARRVKVVGYGKSKPLASNDDESDGRELNRRVEFKVIQN